MAFAVNHERVSQPHTACVVSSEATPAPGYHNSSSSQFDSTRNTAYAEDNLNITLMDIGNSTVTRDLIPTRASPDIRDSTCTFQQQYALEFGEVCHVEDIKRRHQKQETTMAQTTQTRIIRESITNLPNSHQISNSDNKTSNIPIERQAINNDNNEDTKEKKANENNSYGSRLVVDVRSAEAAAAAINSCDGCRLAPVPVTPTYLSPCVHESNIVAAIIGTRRRRVGRPSKKLKSRSKQEQEALSSSFCSRCSALAAKPSRTPKTKRVRYDMECVPSVKINKSLRGVVSLRFCKESQSMVSSLASHCDELISGNHTTDIDSEIKSSSGSSGVMTIPLNNENNIINNLASSPSQLLFQESVLWIPSSRQEWEDCVSEMKAVCTSAAFRRWSKVVMTEFENNNGCIGDVDGNNKHAKTDANPFSSSPSLNATPTSFQPPLSQAFIKDRIQIDDPLRGYQIRHAKGGWLQGFLVWTNFTVWTQDFQWNSKHPCSGLLHDIEEGRSAVDDDGKFSKELQTLPRGVQDPVDGGIVLEQVAEISLLGGLGCGEVLFRKTIEDIRKSKSNNNCDYKFVVLQATEGSRSFYEKVGFVRVGAICRYRWAEYCTNKMGFDGTPTEEKPDLNKIEFKDIDPKPDADPPTFHGYRHWTYTNESCKSLDAHGGPSVMMCLKLEDNEKQMKKHQQTVSGFLKPHLVDAKPNIQLFGNVSNPESENAAPTRKSQRRNTNSGNLTELREEQQQKANEKNAIYGSTYIGIAGGHAAATAITRRTSNRSKRGRNKALANSDYVLYGVEGGRNCFLNTDFCGTRSTKSITKRVQQSINLKRTVSLQGPRTFSDSVNEMVVVLPAVIKIHGDTIIHERASSGRPPPEIRVASPATITNDALSLTNSFGESNGKNISGDVSMTPLRKASDLNKNTTVLFKNVDNLNSPCRDHKSSTMTRDQTSNSTDYPLNHHSAKGRCTKSRKSDFSIDPKTTTTKPHTKSVAFTAKVAKSSVCTYDLNCVDTTNFEHGPLEIKLKHLDFARGMSDDSSPTRAPKKGFTSAAGHRREKKQDISNRNDTAIDPLSSEGGGKTAGRKMRETIKSLNSSKSASLRLTRQQSAKLSKQKAPAYHYGTRHPTIAEPRKRSRQPAIAIDKAKLYKQIVIKNGRTTADIYNKIVVRCNVQSVLEQSCVRHIDKRRRGNGNPNNGRIGLRYNGGLMIDHRYEFCYYFVLHYNESKKFLTLVPMIKDGVFERATGIENSSTVVDEKFLGRPRYECNVLETDRNWICDAPIEDYAIVPEAVAVIDTPFVAQEAWDIVGNGFVPYV